MVAGESFAAITWLGIGVMLLMGWHWLPGLCFFAAFAGVAGALVWPVLTGIIPEIAPKDRLQPANARLAAGGNSARITGLAATGAVVVLIGSG